MTRFLLLGVSVAVMVAACGIVPNPAADGVPGVGASPPVQRGLVLPTWERDGYHNSETQAALRGIAAVGANWVQIDPTWYQAERTSSEIGPTDSSVDDDNLRYAIGRAHAAGLKVLLKPHVDVADGTEDRALIDPPDRDAWFRSYRTFIAHYADLADGLNVEQFAVGTELSALSGDRDRWLSVVAEVRNRYDGPLVYAANHSEYAEVAFWDVLDLVGIDGYWPLSAQPTTDVSQLERASPRYATISRLSPPGSAVGSCSPRLVIRAR